MTRHLRVTLHGHVAGVLTQTASGRLAFDYDAAYVTTGGAPLSISLPVQRESFGHGACEPFFGGLLPEEGVRERIARFLGITPSNDFALLERIGGECAGAVSLTPVDDSIPAHSIPSQTGRTESASTPPVLTPVQLAHLLDELPRRPLLVGGARTERQTELRATPRVASTRHGGCACRVPVQGA